MTEELVPKTTVVRINTYALQTLRKFAEIHSWSVSALMVQLASALREGLDGLMTDDLEQLRRLYRHSELAVIPDVRELKGLLIVKTDDEEE